MGMLSWLDRLVQGGPWVSAVPIAAKVAPVPDGRARPPFERKFSPADASVNWTVVQSLVTGQSGESRGDLNSAVFACLQAICSAYPEPPLRVYQRDREGQSEIVHEHPLQEVFDRPTPNGELTLELLWYWVQFCKHTDGNGYWRKIRAGDALLGNVTQLWPLSPRLVRPITVKGSGEWISHYHYDDGTAAGEDIPKQNIVHFRLGIDPDDMRLGLSPLKRLVRQIATDDEAEKFTDSLLRNFAVPGLVVSVNDPSLDKETADSIKDAIRSNFGTEGRGNIAVVGNDAKLSAFGFSPKDLDLGMLHTIPEERIAAVLRVPPIVAGLGAGLDRSTYSNYQQAREAFTEDTLVPLWRQDAAAINSQLLPDFASDPSIYCAFDLTDVRALQEDEDKKYVRLDLGVRGKWIGVNEARADVGLPPVDGGDLDLSAPAAGQQEQEQPSDQMDGQMDEDMPDGMPGRGEQRGKALAAKHGGAHTGHRGAHAGPGGQPKGPKMDAAAKEHWDSLPEGFRSAAAAGGLKRVSFADEADMESVVGHRASGGYSTISGTYFEGGPSAGTLVVNKGASNPRRTLVHEMAHVADPLGSDGKFTRSESEEWLKASGWKKDKKGNYRLRETDFNRAVSDYARSSPWEDLAESFATFTTGDKYDRRAMAGESEGRYAYIKKLAKSYGFDLPE